MYRTLSILLLVVVLTAAACSGNDDTTNESGDSAATDLAGSDTGSEAAPLSCTDPVTVGVVMDLTGGLSIYGTQLQRGVAIGMSYASGDGVGAGDVRSYTVDDCETRVVFADDQSNPEVAGVVARRLIRDEGAIILVGSVGAGTGSVLRDVAAENNVILLATIDTPGGLSEADFDDNVFLLALSQAQHAYATCGYFAAALGAHTFVQIAPDYPAGRRAAAAYRAACISAGGEFVATDQLLPTATIDFAETISELANDDPDAVLLTWPTGGTGSLLESAATGFPTGTAFGVTFAPDAIVPLFFDSAVGWTSPTTYNFTSPNNPANDYLIEQVEAAGSTPDQYDALGMNAALLAVAALRQSGGGADPGALRAALEGAEISGPKGRLTMRATDHLAIQDTYIVTLVNTDDPGREYYEMIATVRPEPPCLLEGEAAARCG